MKFLQIAILAMMMLVMTTSALAAVYDYDTFTRADSSSMGLTEGLGATYDVGLWYCDITRPLWCTYGYLGVSNGIGLFNGTNKISNAALHGFGTGTLYINASFYSSSSSIRIISGSSDTGSETCMVLCNPQTNHMVASQSITTPEGGNLRDLGVTCNTGAYHQYRISTGSSQGVCKVSVDGGTPVVFDDEMSLSGMYGFDLRSINADEWAVCDTDNMNCNICSPSWSCGTFTSCLINNHKYCTSATDANNCGDTFTGDLGTYTESCSYCYPAWTTMWNRGDCSNRRYNTTLYYVDANNCNSNLALPSDNGTMYFGSCTIDRKGVVKIKNVQDSVIIESVNVTMALGANYSGNLSVTQLENLPTQTVDIGIGSSLKKIVDINFDPVIMSLTQAEVRIYYTPEEIKGLDERKLKLYFYNETSHLWQAIAGSGVNIAGHYVYGVITHFSYYGIGGTQENPTAYAATDLPNIVTDNIGSAAVNFKVWIPLLLLGFVGLVLVGAYTKFRRAGE